MNRGPIIVFHFVHTHRRGGVEEQMLTLLTHLNRTLFFPMLIAPPELIEKMRPDLPSDGAAIGLTPRIIDRQASAWKLWRQLRANRVGILHSHTFHCSRFAAPPGWMAGVPVRVETIHVPQDRSRFRLNASYFRDRVASRVPSFRSVCGSGNSLSLGLTAGLRKITL